MGKAAVSIDLTFDERRELEGFAGRRRTAQGLARRARIVLLALCHAAPRRGAAACVRDGDVDGNPRLRSLSPAHLCRGAAYGFRRAGRLRRNAIRPSSAGTPPSRSAWFTRSMFLRFRARGTVKLTELGRFDGDVGS
jgi:hypothetical protein